MHTSNQKLFFILISAVLFLSACSRDELPQHVLARVDGQAITVDDFKRAYLPVLLYSDKKESPATREEILNFLINQTILANEARDLHLDTIPTLDVLRRTAEKTAFTRMLYKEWVKEIVPTPSEAALRTAFQRSHHSRLVRHLFSPTQQGAYQLYDQLKQGVSWDSLAMENFDDPSLAAEGGVLGWVKFGDMDPDFENAIYELKLHQISKPVRTKFGWHVIRVDEESRELMLTEYDYSLERRQILRKIREQNEQYLADSVANAMMANANLIFAQDVAPKVWTVMRNQIRQLLDSESVPELTLPELTKFEDQLAPILDEEMLSYNGQVWTVEDYLHRLPEMNRQMMLTDVKRATAFLVRDEIIHTEGLKRNMDQRADVQGEIRDRENQFLSNLYLRYKATSQPVSDLVVQNYYRQHSSSKYLAPDSLLIHELVLEDLNQVDKIKSALSNGESPADLGQIFNDVEYRSLGWFQAARADRADYYHRLVNQPLNTPIGPFTRDEEMVIIIATRRHRHPKPFDSVKEQVRYDAEDNRINKLRYAEIQRLSQGKKIEVDLEKLHSQSWIN